MYDKCLHFEREEEFSVIVYDLSFRVYALTRKERFMVISCAGGQRLWHGQHFSIHPRNLNSLLKSVFILTALA